MKEDEVVFYKPVASDMKHCFCSVDETRLAKVLLSSKDNSATLAVDCGMSLFVQDYGSDFISAVNVMTVIANSVEITEKRLKALRLVEVRNSI